MTVHLFSECPGRLGSEPVADGGDTYDCRICIFTSQESDRTWEGGHLLALVCVVSELESLVSGYGVGLSKLEIFRRLVVRLDPKGTAIKNSPDYIQCFLTMDSKERSKSCCNNCGEGLEYLSTSNGKYLWVCQYGECGSTRAIEVNERCIPMRPTS